ncbi:porphobilinogen deaminase-like protein [Ascodesmis nigricans]|uniref:Porphobilinogen deaminase n=1 Tax=Ascodesmis nigricans TaxID=341454 RepID=A0A4S2N432_9PEZI|nr:porphobilinogen deaminase-like protein [Ascodesmis nigricans]
MISYTLLLLQHQIYRLLGLPPPFMDPRELKVGTRDSVLAMAQTHIVISQLLKNHRHVTCTTTSLKTSGDKNLTQALFDIPSKSVWTAELETLLLEHSVDLVVHSLKDMPTILPDGCELGCVLTREDPRDALVLSANCPEGINTLADLPAGSVVGTSSIRRIAQLRRKYPHLKITDMRGNVPSRLRKLDDPALGYTAAILAAAGLHRLGLEKRINQYLEYPEMLHAVGQGAIGVEIRKGDEELRSLLAPLRCDNTALAALAERALLRRLEGGCSVPIGVQTSWEGKVLKMKAAVISVDGTESVECEEAAEVNDDDEAETYGVSVAETLLEKGAGPILDRINRERQAKPPVAEGEH